MGVSEMSLSSRSGVTTSVNSLGYSTLAQSWIQIIPLEFA